MPLVRTAARTALGAREVVKDLRRLQEIVQVLARHGLGWIVASVEVPGIGLLRNLVPDESRSTPTPERVAAVIRDLGPTFVKLGQMLSTRSDVIPAEYAAALVPLQDDVGPIPWEEVEAQVRAALGKSPDEAYARFDRTPLATASIAQVHRAALASGQEVAVKIQRQGVRQKIETDLSILQFLARRVERQLPEVALLDAPGVLREIGRSIAEETDFRIEADHLDRFRKNLARQPDVIVPEVFRSHSTDTVLTLGFLDGVKIRDAREKGHDLHKVGQTLMRADFQMLLEDGFFHGDLHPGNVLVLPGDQVGLLDFGMVGRLTEEMRENLVALLFAVQRRDWRTVARIYFELAIKPENVDYGAFERDVQELFERQLVGRSIADLQIEDFVRRLGQGALRHRVRLTPAYTMLFKALITAEGLAKQLLPEVDPLQEMIPYVERMAKELYSPERLQKELFFQLVSLRYTARRVPVVIGQVVSDLQEGKLRLRVAAEEAPGERRVIDRRVNRAVAAVLASGLVVGGALAQDAGAARLLGLSPAAAACYGLALVLVLWLLRGLWRTGGL